MQALAQAPSLASLRELQLDDALLDDAALRALASSPHLRSLQTLSFERNHAISDDGIVMLAESPVLANVRSLSLIGTGATERGIATLPDHVAVKYGPFTL